MLRVCLYLFNVASLFLVWWFGIVFALDTWVIEKYGVTLWSIPETLFSMQTAHMANLWFVIACIFVSLFGLAGWLTDWIFKSPVYPWGESASKPATDGRTETRS